MTRRETFYRPAFGPTVRDALPIEFLWSERSMRNINEVEQSETQKRLYFSFLLQIVHHLDYHVKLMLTSRPEDKDMLALKALFHSIYFSVQ